MSDPVQKLSVFVEELAQRCSRPNLTLENLLHELHAKGHMLVCLVFAAPFLLPIPLPGLSTVFGAVIFLAAIQVILAIDPWLPKPWRTRKIPGSVVQKTLSTLAKFLKRIEWVVRPRIKYFANHPGLMRITGCALLVLAILLSLPMPPGFNAPPALAIILLALGSLEEDGVIVIAGWVLTVVNIALFTAAFTFGWEGLKLLMPWITAIS